MHRLQIKAYNKFRLKTFFVVAFPCHGFRSFFSTVSYGQTVLPDAEFRLNIPPIVTETDTKPGADPGKLQGEGHESKLCPLPIPKIKNSSDFGHLILVVPYFQFLILIFILFIFILGLWCPWALTGLWCL